MEKYLRAACDPKLGELRSGSTVVAIEEDENNVYVHYNSLESGKHAIKANFLVGADGKTGFVRKKYLEPKGINMEKNDK
jgi:2-polyprenyl-6-methoxyphenol hydroxylase-like FAD-dependent oxidoreductase